MAVTIDDFYEIVEDTGSKSTSGFSLQGGKSVMTLGLDLDLETDTDASVIQEAVTLLIGGTSQEVGDGRLNRTPPIAHPMFPFQYISAISTIRGTGKYILAEADAELEAVTLPNFALYETYFFTCEFTQRPYALLDDSDIDVDSGIYTDESGTPQPFTWATEWNRYVEVTLNSKEEAITAVQGLQFFRTQSTANPNKFTLAQMPKIYMPNQLLRVKWYQIPERYLSSSNSYFSSVDFVGHINQFGILGYQPGQLLYLGYTPTLYTPPVPELVEWAPGTFSTERLMDVELTFFLTSRKVTDAPTPTNLNWIAAFWNSYAWLTTRKFYYVTASDNTPANQVPPFLSAPMELLFTDPDA